MQKVPAPATCSVDESFFRSAMTDGGKIRSLALGVIFVMDNPFFDLVTGAIFSRLVESRALRAKLDRGKTVARSRCRTAGLGFHPIRRRLDHPHSPKGRKRGLKRILKFAECDWYFKVANACRSALEVLQVSAHLIREH